MSVSGLAKGGALERLLAPLLGELLRGEACRGWTLSAADANGSTVSLKFDRAPAALDVWLKPAAAEGGAYRRTAQFAIGYRGGDLDAATRGFMDALCARVAAGEPAVTDALRAEVFPQVAAATTDGAGAGWEWGAVRAWLKPACRQVASRERAESVVQQAQAQGLVALALDAADVVAGWTASRNPGSDTLIYVAPTADAAQSAADAERADNPEALGRALGYPPCCIAAFTPVRDQPNAAIRFAALSRTHGRTHLPFVLDDFEPKNALISHFPCSYDCEPSRQYAESVLALLRREAAPRAQALARALRGAVVAFPRGALRLVEGEAARDGIAFGAAVPYDEVPAAWLEAARASDSVQARRAAFAFSHDGDEVCVLEAPRKDVLFARFV